MKLCMLKLLIKTLLRAIAAGSSIIALYDAEYSAIIELYDVESAGVSAGGGGAACVTCKVKPDLF